MKIRWRSTYRLGAGCTALCTTELGGDLHMILIDINSSSCKSKAYPYQLTSSLVKSQIKASYSKFNITFEQIQKPPQSKSIQPKHLDSGSRFEDNSIKLDNLVLLSLYFTSALYILYKQLHVLYK